MYRRGYGLILLSLLVFCVMLTPLKADAAIKINELTIEGTSFEEAVSAVANDGDVIDLGGGSYDVSSDIANGKTFTVKNGKLNVAKDTINITDGTNVTFGESLTVKGSFNTISVGNSSSVTINGTSRDIAIEKVTLAIPEGSNGQIKVKTGDIANTGGKAIDALGGTVNIQKEDQYDPQIAGSILLGGNSTGTIATGNFTGSVTASNSGKLTIANGTFTKAITAKDGGEITIKDPSRIRDCVFSTSNGTVNIEGGYFKAGVGVVSADTEGKIIITGGEFDYDITAWQKGKIEISGGTFNNPVHASSEANVTINGGEFKGKIESEHSNTQGAYEDAVSNITINGGTIKGNVTAKYKGTITINDGAVNGEIGIKDSVDNAAQLIINGGTFKNDPKDYIPNGKKVEETDGIYTVVSDGSDETPETPKTVKLTVTAGENNGTVSVKNSKGEIPDHSGNVYTVSTSDIITLEAIPNDGYRFLGWYDGSENLQSDEPTTTRSFQRDTAYTAKFKSTVEEAAVTLNPNGGTPGSAWPRNNVAYFPKGSTLNTEELWGLFDGDNFITPPAGKEIESLTIKVGSGEPVEIEKDDTTTQVVISADTEIILNWKDASSGSGSGKASSTIDPSDITAVFTGEAVQITVKVKDSKTGNEVVLSDGLVTYKYYDENKKELSEAPVNAGTYYVVAYFAGNDKYAAMHSDYIKLTIDKADNTLKATGKTVKLKAKKIRKKVNRPAEQVYTIQDNVGDLSFKKAGKAGGKKIAVNKKTGKMIFKKGLKKGKYKVKVKITAAGDDNYKAGTSTVKVKVKVK